MTRISFGPLLHQTLGFEKFIRDVETILDSEIKPSTFPPHNIIKADDNKYVVELAVAGFAKDEIDIQVQEGNLTIKGDKKDKDESNYLHRGIGTRTFKKTVTLAETVQVDGASLENGILTVKLVNIVPVEKLPVKIAINTVSKPQLLQEKV